MNNEKNKSQNGNDALFNFLKALGIMGVAISGMCLKGAKNINWKNQNIYPGFLLWMVVALSMVKADFVHLKVLDSVFALFGGGQVFYNLSYFGLKVNAALLVFVVPILFIFGLGVIDYFREQRYQSAFRKQGLKNSLKEEPKVKKIIKIDDNRSLIRVSSPGISPEEWKRKQNALAFDFKVDIDEIKVSEDRNYIEIYVSEKPLPRVVKYEKYKDVVQKPYTFVVGEAKNGEFITESIRNCPHVLMGGATGMGKSTSFKLMLYSLLKSTPEENISFTLIDLKRGVEVAEFDGFSNVTVAKNESSAVKELKKISEEMHRRYRYLESKKRTKIDPKADKKPLIIVGVDEASVIFGVRSQSSDKKVMSDEARELCEEIAKLGRAAGIHMILATQRATKTSIDTVTLDNLEARVCFRTRSVAGSTAILGDKSGSTLPDIPGRAIWQKGIKSVNLQVPYVKEEELTKLCDELKKARASSKLVEAVKGSKLKSSGLSEIEKSNSTETSAAA